MSTDGTPSDIDADFAKQMRAIGVTIVRPCESEQEAQFQLGVGQVDQAEWVANATCAHTIPTHTMSDYAEMLLYALMSAIGGTINGICMRRLMQQYKRKKANLHQAGEATLNNSYAQSHVQFNQAAAFLLLKIHLTSANLLVLLVVCPLRLVWLIAYRWPFGQLM